MYGDSGVVFGALASTCRYALADLGTQLFSAQLVAHPGEQPQQLALWQLLGAQARTQSAFGSCMMLYHPGSSQGLP